jgi:hypothetical protein
MMIDLSEIFRDEENALEKYRKDKIIRKVRRKKDVGLKLKPIKDLTKSRSLSRLANKERNSV